MTVSIESAELPGDCLLVQEQAIRRVLIYRIGSLGDTIVALPCFHMIADKFPQAQRLLLTNFPVHAKAPAAATILEGSGLVHGYMRYTIGTRNPGELFRLTWEIRRFRPDLLVYLTPPRGEKAVKRDAAFFRFSGVRRIVGLPLGDLAHSRHNASTNLWEREAARLTRCLHELGTVDLFNLRNWDLWLTDVETSKASNLLAPLNSRPIISCGPGTKMQAKEWGRNNWRHLLDRLTDQFPDHGLVMIGSKEDSEVSQFAAAGWKAPVLNFCGQLTPRESAAVIRNARLFLGADSGPMHIAASLGIPCAAPFAALDLPGRWFPLGEKHRCIYHPVECSNCRLTTCIEKKKVCITSISVEEMFQAALQASDHEESINR